ncbi:hypothetical protein Tco_1438105 [Tanacetum coccineum]
MIDADYELAARLQSQEQEELTIEEKSKLFIELMDKIKKNFARPRAEEQRRIPPTKAQKRYNMLFDKAMTRVNTFVDMDTELVKGSETRTKGSSKRAGEELESKNLKKQKLDENVEAKVDDDQEEAEMKKHMEIVPDEEVAIDAIPLATKPPIIVDWKIIKEGKMGYFQIIRADGSSKRYSSMIQMLQNIDREDLETLWKLVKAKHGLTRPEEGYERVLWGDLKVMFEPDVESEVWRNLQGHKVTVWKLFSSSGVHFMRFQNLHIFMLVEKRYPLTPATITEMLNKKLQADHWNEMCYQLLKLMTKQLKNPGSGRIVGIKRLHDDLGVNTAKVRVTAAKHNLVLMVLLGFSLICWLVLRTVLMVDSITFGQEMVNILLSGKEYDKVFNHLDMLHAPLEGKGNLSIGGGLIHDPNEMVDIPDNVDLVDYDGDDEENPEEDSEEDPEEEPEPNNGHGDQFAQHPNPQPGNMNGWLEEDDDMNENVNDEDIEDEDVEIEVDDDAELIFPYEVEGDQTPPPRDESSDSEPPNAESSNSVSSDSELEDEEADVAPEDTFGTITQRPYAVRDFPRGVFEVGEPSSAHDSSYVGGLAPWALRHRGKEREIPNHDLGNVEHVLGDVLERLKVLESRENATSKKKLVEAEMKLELARMERDMVERRLHASYRWNKRFYMEMVRIRTVPKPPSNDEGTERPRKKSKKSSFDGTEGPSEPRGPPSDS